MEGGRELRAHGSEEPGISFEIYVESATSRPGCRGLLCQPFCVPPYPPTQHYTVVGSNIGPPIETRGCQSKHAGSSECDTMRAS